MSLRTEARNATLEDLAALLREQHARKLDVVAPAAAISARDGRLVLSGTEADISRDGVTATDGVYVPTEVCDAGLADKLSIPLPYLRRLRQTRPDLWDANINGWLHGGAWHRHILDRHGVGARPGRMPATTAESRSFLVRCFRGDDNAPGIARAFLSDRYGIVDNLDVLLAALTGVRDAGVHIDIDGCDLTERRMYVRVVAPQIAAYAPDLLAGYRSPFDGRDIGRGWTPQRVALAGGEGHAYQPGDQPVIFAGFVISNSETGGGAFTLTPRLVVQICRNGLQITADALREVHLGARMDEGIVRWSADTQQRALQLITAKTRDAVATFLDHDYVTAKVNALTDKAATPIKDPVATVELVTKRLSWTEQQQTTILDHFIRGGQATAGGVMQAVTSAAQAMHNADLAYEMEAAALRVLDLAAAAR